MDRNSRGYKLIALAQNDDKNEANEIGLNCSSKEVCDLGTDSVNEDFVKSSYTSENLQSDLPNLIVEVQLTKELLELEGNHDVLPSSYVDKIISNIDDIAELFNTDLFFEHVLNRVDKCPENIANANEVSAVPDVSSDENVPGSSGTNEVQNTEAEEESSSSSEEEVTTSMIA